MAQIPFSASKCINYLAERISRRCLLQAGSLLNFSYQPRRYSDGCGGSVKDQLLRKVADAPENSSDKVTVVGVGNVGMACAFSLLAQNITSHLALVDMNENRLKGEMLDLQHGSLLLKDAKISAGKDYAVTAHSRVIIVTAGARQMEGESRLNLIQKNADIYKCMIPELVKHSPNCIMIIVSNPVDVLTYVAWKLSGLPVNRIMGSGTSLDTVRFRAFISQRLHIAPSSAHGWIIGEHGDSSVPVWSGVSVAGVRLQDLNHEIGTEEDKENWRELHKKVVESAMTVIKLKGYTSWAIGLTTADLVSSILRNESKVRAVTTNVKGYHCVDKEVFLSLPCVLGECGISHIVNQTLSSRELKQFQKSAEQVYEVQSKAKF